MRWKVFESLNSDLIEKKDRNTPDIPQFGIAERVVSGLVASGLLPQAPTVFYLPLMPKSLCQISSRFQACQ